MTLVLLKRAAAEFEPCANGCAAPPLIIGASHVAAPRRANVRGHGAEEVTSMQHDRTAIKLCECGCGEPAPIARRTRPERGQVAGEPVRFIRGHSARVLGPRGLRDPAAACANPEGLCWCGCGERTPLAKRTQSARGDVAGQPLRYVPGHSFKYFDGAQWVEDPQTGCWLWQYSVSPQGYARWGKTYAHRRVYEQLRGPIPAGLSLDHLCRVPRCVNPDHLEPVTHAENVRRGVAARRREKAA